MRYTLSAGDPGAHLFDVTLDLEAPDPSGQELMLPAWIPGSYMIRDFARHVVALAASDRNGALAVTKRDKQTWRCAPADGALRVRYQVYAWDFSVRAAALDATGGFCNGTSVFLRPIGLVDGPFEVRVERGAGAPDWRVATTLPALEHDEAGFGRYRAADYEALVDHPLRIGTFRTLHFEVTGVPHEVVIPGSPRLDGDRLCADLARTCAQHVAVFGELPVDRYVFFMHLVGSGYGGLEHRASTVLDVARDSLPQPGDAADRDDYRQLLGLCSHEYFHLWHVKRIRPEAFIPYDLSREVHTTQLWAFEGITSYYDDLALLRAGVLDERAWLDRLEQLITRVHRGHGRLLQTLEASSFDAWTRFYKADENAPNAVVSYYAKGALAALALDLTIRAGTAGTSTLDDVMRALWADYGRQNIGVPEGGIERTAEQVSGLDLAPFFEGALRSTRDLDLSGLFDAFGIALQWEAASPSGAFAPDLGVTIGADGGLPRVQQVLAGSAGRQAGLAPGDRIVALDDVHVTADRLADRAARLPRHEPLEVHVLRDDRLLALTLTLADPPVDRARLHWMSEVSPAVAERRASWLGRS